MIENCGYFRKPAPMLVEPTYLPTLIVSMNITPLGQNGAESGEEQHAVRLYRTGHQEFPDPRSRDALHPLCRPGQPGCGGERDATGPWPQQHRARYCLLGLQLCLCAVSADRRLVCGPLRRAAHVDRLWTDMVDHDDSDRSGDRARIAVCGAPGARHGRGCD